MIDILAKFENIGPSHMQAPNDEGLLGYGGHCFPKDTQAFYDFTNSDIMKQVIEVNNRLREASDSSRND
jgi:UDP-glucose 6-dehydrogenase